MHYVAGVQSNQPLLNPHTMTRVCDLILGSLGNQAAKWRANYLALVLTFSDTFCIITTYGPRNIPTL